MTNDLNPAGVEAAAEAYDDTMDLDVPTERLVEAAIRAYLASLPRPEGETDHSADVGNMVGETAELVAKARDALVFGTGKGLYDAEATGLIHKLADAITSLSQRLAVAEARLAVSDSRWRDTVQGHAAAMRMVIDATEELFGAVASVESEDASLLRGPEPRHRAEGGVEALQRVAARLAVMEAERDEARKVLAEHHEWHLQSGEIGLPDGEGGWIAIDNASAYSESSLYDRTAEIISTHPPELKPAPRGGVVHNWWAQWVLQGRILKTTLARADAAEAQLAHAREALRQIDGIASDTLDMDGNAGIALAFIRKVIGDLPAQ